MQSLLQQSEDFAHTLASPPHNLRSVDNIDSIITFPLQKPRMQSLLQQSEDFAHTLASPPHNLRNFAETKEYIEIDNNSLNILLYETMVVILYYFILICFKIQMKKMFNYPKV